jgi:uncharacterized protein (DUF924 family)
MSAPQAAEVLRFWFEETTPAQWFHKDPSFDRQLRKRFGELTEQAPAGGLQAWARDPAGGLGRGRSRAGTAPVRADAADAQ